MDNEELSKLLDAVSINASKLNSQNLQKMNIEESKKPKEKETNLNNPLNNVNDLPLAAKMQILSFLQATSDLKTSNVGQVVPEDQTLPGVEFLKFLKPQPNLNFFSKEDLGLLEERGYIIRDRFLGTSLLNSIYSEADSLLQQGKLRPAGMSKGNEFWNDSKIRGDKIMWINEKWQIQDSSPSIYTLLTKIDLLRQELNENCQFNSEKTQTQLTCYPGEGARYVRHLDAYKNGSTRRITVLYYLNPNWKKADGGCLRLYLKDGFKDVEPLGDRLLIFQSRRIEHEVLSSYNKRFATTVWFY